MEWGNPPQVSVCRRCRSHINVHKQLPAPSLTPLSPSSFTRYTCPDTFVNLTAGYDTHEEMRNVELEMPPSAPAEETEVGEGSMLDRGELVGDAKPAIQVVRPVAQRAAAAAAAEGKGKG
jgi:hypothetical protein